MPLEAVLTTYQRLIVKGSAVVAICRGTKLMLSALHNPKCSRWLPCAEDKSHLRPTILPREAVLTMHQRLIMQHSAVNAIGYVAKLVL